ncbi:hypothetical protein ACTXT7_010331 [Hymenolepis weldensis]
MRCLVSSCLAKFNVGYLLILPVFDFSNGFKGNWVRLLYFRRCALVVLTYQLVVKAVTSNKCI